MKKRSNVYTILIVFLFLIQQIISGCTTTVTKDVQKEELIREVSHKKDLDQLQQNKRNAGKPVSHPLSVGKNETIRGTIIENMTEGAAIDLPAFLRVNVNWRNGINEEEQFIAKIVYSPGRVECLNIIDGFSFKEDDDIEVYGIATGEYEISTCGSNDYYISKLK